MPLRILHTADWHVGRAIARRPRLDEHRAVLAEIVEIAESRRVDVVVVAGDLFDRQNPSPEAERVVYDALADLRRAARHVVVVSGNHDSPRRWEALARLAGSVHIVARLHDDLSRHVIEVEGADGTRASLACLPWVPERHFLRAEHVSHGVEPEVGEGMAGLIRDLVALAGRDGRPVVLAAHLNAAGALLGGSERPRAVDGDSAVPAAAFPDALAYAALGHVHRPQRIGSSGAVHYSGSILQLDFAERGDTKGVVLATVGDGDTRVETVPLTRGVPLERIEGTLADIEAMAAAGDVPAGHVQVRLACDGPAPGLGDRVRDLVEGCVDVRLVYERPQAATAPSLRDVTLREMFARYLTLRAGFAEADPELLQRFESLVEDEEPSGGELVEDAA
jgi:exonuclease SbcD